MVARRKQNVVDGVVGTLLQAHPLCVAVLPLLALYAHNADQVLPGELWPVLAGPLLLALPLYLALRRLLGDAAKAAVLCSAGWLWLFSWGHACQLVSRCGGGRLLTDWRELLAAAWVLLLVAGGWGLVRTRRDLAPLSRAFGIAALALLALQLPALMRAARPLPPARPAAVAAAAHGESRRPDIYFLVLDAYARADVLREVCGLDNGPFLRALEQRGFYIADRSASNYATTERSLAATLDLGYLPTPAPLRPTELVEDSRLCRHLRHLGYRVASFASGYGAAEMRTADIYLRPPGGSTDFHRLAWNLTVFPVIAGSLRSDESHAFGDQRDCVLYVLGHLGEVFPHDRPLFVYAHLMCPHPPFVFGRHGEFPRQSGVFENVRSEDMLGTMPRPEYIRAYADQLEYLNGLVLQSIDRLLARVPADSIVIVQADHGPRFGLGDLEQMTPAQARQIFGVLNAIRLPGGAAELRPDMSPINTFRVVLRHCFGLPYPDLPDESYYGTLRHPYDLQRVTGLLARPAAGG